MLEEHVVHVPASKTHFAQDVSIDRERPIFFTGKGPMMFVKNGQIDDGQSDMVACRWKVNPKGVT